MFRNFARSYQIIFYLLLAFLGNAQSTVIKNVHYSAPMRTWQWEDCVIDTVIVKLRENRSPDNTYYHEIVKRCCINPTTKDTQCINLHSSFKGWIGENYKTYYDNGLLKTWYDLHCLTLLEPMEETFYYYLDVFDTLICPETAEIIVLQRVNFNRYTLPTGDLVEKALWVNDTCFYESYHNIKMPLINDELYYASLPLAEKGQYLGRIDNNDYQYKKMGTWYYYNDEGSLIKEENYPIGVVHLRRRKRPN